MNVYTINKEVTTKEVNGVMEDVFYKVNSRKWLLNSKIIKDLNEFEKIFETIAIYDAIRTAEVAIQKLVKSLDDTKKDTDKYKKISNEIKAYKVCLNKFKTDYTSSIIKWCEFEAYLNESTDRKFIGLIYFGVSKSKNLVPMSLLETISMMQGTDITNRDDMTACKNAVETKMHNYYDAEDSAIFKQWQVRIKDEVMTNMLKLFIDTYNATNNGIELKKYKFDGKKTDVDIYFTARQICLQLLTHSYGVYSKAEKTTAEVAKF